MTRSGSGWCWKLGLVSSLAIGGAIASPGDCAFAQITPDTTLPINSSVTLQGNTSIITGGTAAGGNLFHSFEQFSVSTGNTAYFNNALDIQNIISRVTGSSTSNIDGSIQANGTANLFLLNPNGIIFGPNASLDTGGSFLASTTSSLIFADGTQFSPTAPQTTPLLTVSVPIGLQFGATPGRILNQSQASPGGATNSIGFPVGLQVQTGKTLALVGGDLELEGGNLTAAGGRIELGSVAGNSLVSLNPANQGWVLRYEGAQNFRNIQLTQRTVDGSKIPSFVDASGAGGGDIQVQGRRVMLTDGSQILTTTLGAQPGGTLRVIASESVELIDPGTFLRTQTNGAGDAAALTITTGRLIVQDSAQIITSTLGKGSGGPLTVNASESVELIGTLPNGFYSGLVSATAAAGNAGDIKIETGSLLINGASISTESAGIFLQPTLATGQGGNLTVNASESVKLINNGFIATTTQGSGDAGNLTLNTGMLLAQEGAQVSASTVGEGKGGILTVNASDSVELSGENSGLFSATVDAGDAGNLRIATRELIIRDGAEVTVSSKGTGDAGNLTVTARSIRLDNQGVLLAEAASGEGGNITLQAGDVRLRRESNISTTAGTQGNPGAGGQITINTDTLVGLENSDITANAFEGKGGTINITAQGIFGLVQRDLEDLKTLLGSDGPNNPDSLNPQRLPSSDITAISQTDPSLRGQVIINRPDVDPSQGLVNLPEEVVDVTGLVAQGCSADGGKADRGASEFTVTGRGGLPPTPRETLSSDTILEDWGTPTLTSAQPLRPRQHDATENRSGSPAVSTHPTRPTPAPLVEATGWVIGAKGEVILTATAPTTTPHSPWRPPATCHAP